MPLFCYQALSETGKQTKATIDAESIQDAKQKLLRLQIIAIRIDPVTDKEMKRPLSKREVLSLTREIARLLQAGLPLYETLSALEEKYRGQKPHKILLDLCEKVKTGQPLSSALFNHPNTFDILYTSMVANAEKTGRLAPCFDELAQLMMRQLHVRKQITGALLYPAILATFCLVVFSSLLFFVIPSLRELFEGRDLHPFTKIVFAASEFACNAKGTLVGVVASLLLAICMARLSQKWRSKGSALLLKLPMLRPLFAKVSLIRFARASATLLEGGLSLMAVLAQAKTVIRHPILEKVIARAEERIAEGEPLSSCFENVPIIPPLVPRMLGIAEQSGKLSFTLQQIAQIYEEELETTLANFANLAQPILLLFLGALVGFVLLSVLLPLTDVSSFVS